MSVITAADKNRDHIPNPGSQEAEDQGCTCPVMDNCRGRGYMGGAKDQRGMTVFVITGGCPVHDSGDYHSLFRQDD